MKRFCLSCVTCQRSTPKSRRAKARNRVFSKGDLVMLFCSSGKELLMQWIGPFHILSRIGRSNYEVDVNGHLMIFHASLLKRYHVVS